MPTATTNNSADGVMDGDSFTLSPLGDADAGAAGDCILLVDDDAVARLLTASALTERRWRVIEADNGTAALALFRAHAPDVVVLDALMPEVDGFVTCEHLRRLTEGRHVPILMLTGLDDETSIARAYEAGATDFFVKTTGQWTLLSERLRYMLRSSRMRAELALSQAKLTKAQRIARLGSWEWDIAKRRVRMSEESFAIAGLPAQDDGLPDGLLWSRVLEEDRAQLPQLFRAALAGQAKIDVECRIVRPNGQLRVVQVEGEIDRDDHGRATGLHGVLQDITERKRAEDKIRQLANYDSLTGLPNRRFFRDQFAAAIERARTRGQQVAVLFIDVDRFKQINDTLGHQAGDQMLREIAKRLYQTVRDSDTVARGADPEPAAAGAEATGDAADDPMGRTPRRDLMVLPPPAMTGNSVARLGGDEFTVLLSEIADSAVVEVIAARLLEAIRRPIQCAGHEVFPTASIGLAVYPRDGDDVESLVRKADMAMYAVKDRGRNGWLQFQEAMNTITAGRWRLETALHRALERKELVLHYQPKIDVRSGRVVGAEALMRWRRDGALIAPGEFIAVAEESGLIVPITEWAIGAVCEEVARWSALALGPVPVSVNISSRHVQRADLIKPIERALAAAGCSPQDLELELTETVLMQNLDAALPLMQSLKELGVSISIDDFGTGYSSLAYLRRLPIDTLKIDRSFVRDLESSQDSAAIVAAIIAMSRSLNLRVVAEGVETIAQMSKLGQQGCALMQGFLFARPLPPDQFVAFLDETGAGRADWRCETPGSVGGVPHAPADPAAAVNLTRPDVDADADGAERDPDDVGRARAQRWARRFGGRLRLR